MSLHRLAWAAFASAVATVAVGAAVAAGWTDRLTQDIAMLAVIALFGLAAIAALLHATLLAATVVAALRDGARSVRGPALYLAAALVAAGGVALALVRSG